jgi:hypothetical protein
MLERSDMMKYDRVELHQLDGQVRVLTPEEFLALPAVDRVQGIGKGRFRFSLAGQNVRPIDAIKVDRQTA